MRPSQIFGLPPRSGEPMRPNPSQGGDFEVEQLYSVERRLRDMERQHLDMHALSVVPSFFYAR